MTVHIAPIINRKGVRHIGLILFHHLSTFVMITIIDFIPYMCVIMWILYILNTGRIVLRSILTTMHLYNKIWQRKWVKLSIVIGIFVTEILYISLLGALISNFTFVASLVFVVLDYKLTRINIQELLNSFRQQTKIDNTISDDTTGDKHEEEISISSASVL
jgi:hypothetical protein